MISIANSLCFPKVAFERHAHEILLKDMKSVCILLLGRRMGPLTQVCTNGLAGPEWMEIVMMRGLLHTLDHLAPCTPPMSVVRSVCKSYPLANCLSFLQIVT